MIVFRDPAEVPAGLRSVGRRDRQVRRRALRPPRGDRPGTGGCRDRRRAGRRGHVRPQPARAAAPRALPREPDRRAPEAAAARRDRHRRDAHAALRRGARRTSPRASSSSTCWSMRSACAPCSSAGLPLRARRSGQPRRCCASSAPSSASTSTSSTTCARSSPAAGCRRPGSASCSARATSRRPAKLLGRPASVWGEVVHGAQARARARLPDGEPLARSRGLRPGGRRLRRLAHRRGLGRRAALRHPLSRRDQRRHQPDLRRRAGPPGRGVRARRDRSRPLRPQRRGAVRSRIRGMVAFEGIEPLKAQIADDVEQVRAALS